MNDLRKRFGLLLLAHRKRVGLTQDALASAADLSSDMIKRLEAGQTGASFSSIEKLATALAIDPAELFTAELPSTGPRSEARLSLYTRLAGLSDPDIRWINNLLDAAFTTRS